MPAPLSVIIPTLNDAARLPDIADALLEGVGDGLIAEVILSDGGSTDATRTIAAEVGAVWLDGPPGQVAQMMRGAAVARAPWLLFCPPDANLRSGWPRAVLAHINRDPDAAGYLANIDTSGLGEVFNRLLRRPPVAQALMIKAVGLSRKGTLPALPARVDRTFRGALSIPALPL